jgi:hypothetical protein
MMPFAHVCPHVIKHRIPSISLEPYIRTYDTVRLAWVIQRGAHVYLNRISNRDILVDEYCGRLTPLSVPLTKKHAIAVVYASTCAALQKMLLRYLITDVARIVMDYCL